MSKPPKPPTSPEVIGTDLKVNATIDALIREGLLREEGEYISMTAKGGIALHGILKEAFAREMLENNYAIAEGNDPESVFAHFCKAVIEESEGGHTVLIRHFAGIPI
jgi:hypothetical protein